MMEGPWLNSVLFQSWLAKKDEFLGWDVEFDEN